MSPAERNIAIAIAKPRRAAWYPRTPVDRRVCDACGVEKIATEYGGKSGGRTRNLICRVCAKAAGKVKLAEAGRANGFPARGPRREPRELPNRHGEARPGSVAQLFYCADCAARGIISPVPAGKRCPFHKPGICRRVDWRGLE